MDAARDVLIISSGVGKTWPCRVWAPHTKHLNRAMVVVGELLIVHQVRATTVKVKLTSVTDQLQSIVDIETRMQQKESNPLHWNRIDTRIP